MFQKDSRYFKLGVTLLMVILISVLCYTIFNHLSDFLNGIKSILSVFSSMAFGLVFAYLMNPVMKLVERLVQHLLGQSNITERGLKKLSRSVGVVVALVVFVLIIYAIIAMVVPQLVTSLKELFSQRNLQKYYNTIMAWVDNFAKGTALETWLQEHNLLDYVQNLFSRINLAQTIGSAFNSVYSVAKILFDVIIGVVFAIYMLVSKDKFIAQTKKLTVAIFPRRAADRILEVARLTNQSLGGFIVGKLIDSLIVGVISYVGMRILGLPYALLGSVFVGVTNIVPFFGPLIGIVIGTILILLQSPLQALYFLIFEFALQQVDGNIIGPKILGDRLGISDFWILVSITVFTGFFGFAGMILGVPVFTVLYTLISTAINKALDKKELPAQTDAYYSILSVEDLEEYAKEFGESTVFYSEDTFETEYDPDEDIEYDNPDE